MDFDAELNAALADTFHSTAFSYTPPEGAAIPDLFGDFRRDTAEVGGDDGGAAVTTRVPVLGVRLSDLPDGTTYEEDATITMGALTGTHAALSGTTWRISFVDDNGAGMAWLHLHKES